MPIPKHLQYLGKLHYIKFFPNGSYSAQYDNGGECVRGNTVPLGDGITAHVHTAPSGKQYATLSND